MDKDALGTMKGSASVSSIGDLMSDDDSLLDEYDQVNTAGLVWCIAAGRFGSTQQVCGAFCCHVCGSGDIGTLSA